MSLKAHSGAPSLLAWISKVPTDEPEVVGVTKNVAEVTVVFRLKSKPTAACWPEVMVTVSLALPVEKVLMLPP